MDKTTYVFKIIFYVIRHYKRIDLLDQRHNLRRDMKLSLVLLESLTNNRCVDKHILLLCKQIDSWGYDFDHAQTFSSSNAYPQIIYNILKRTLSSVILITYNPFYKNYRYQTKLKKILMAIQDLPKVAFSKDFHDLSIPYPTISEKDALTCVSSYLGDEYLKKLCK